eukprot:GHVR01064406.1.p1 GENE.GHVR01064406.1~~GHVR01064406.1.p1  ORF type:complete len:201 (-),score=13.65 GHVR01064406.1:2-604(-)
MLAQFGYLQLVDLGACLDRLLGARHCLADGFQAHALANQQVQLLHFIGCPCLAVALEFLCHATVLTRATDMAGTPQNASPSSPAARRLMTALKADIPVAAAKPLASAALGPGLDDIHINGRCSYRFAAFQEACIDQCIRPQGATVKITLKFRTTFCDQLRSNGFGFNTFRRGPHAKTVRQADDSANNGNAFFARFHFFDE